MEHRWGKQHSHGQHSHGQYSHGRYSQGVGDFVGHLDIAVAGSGRLWRQGDFAGLEEDAPQPAGAYVAAASVVAFADGIYGQQREDLLNSTLLAQLAATRSHDREKDMQNWYADYREVLVKLGWRRDASGRPRLPVPVPVTAGGPRPLLPGLRTGSASSTTRGLADLSGLPGLSDPSNFPILPNTPKMPSTPAKPQLPILPSLRNLPNFPILRPGPLRDPPGRRPMVNDTVPTFPFKPVSVRQPRFTAEQAVLATLHSKTDDAALRTTAAALEKLQALDERDRRTVIFESSSRAGASGSFQIIAASPVSDTLIRMTMAAVFFVTAEQVNRVLTFNFGKGSTQMVQVCDTLLLDSVDYDAVRDQVIDQLGDQAAALIDQIDLG